MHVGNEMTLFGIEVQKKTDILALSAFLLSVAGIVSQLVILSVVLWRGAVVTLFPAEQIMFKSQSLEENGKAFVRIGARMAYTNSGAEGHNAVISREIVAVNFGDSAEYSQKWQTFESFDIVDSQLKSIERKPANPLPINAGGAISHDTYFIPFRKLCHDAQEKCDEWQNYLPWDVFIEKISSVKEIQLKLTGELLGEDSVETECIVKVDDNLLARLDKHGWASPSCIPITKRG